MTDRLLAYAQHRVHPLVRAWLSAETIENNLLEELNEDLERLCSDALAAEFRHYCPVAGASPDDYKNRLLKVGGLELLAGIRFLSLDLAQPFVDVMYASKPVLTSNQLTDIQDAIRQEFRVFQPKRTRFYVPSQLPRFSGDGDKRLIAAPLGVMLAQPELGTAERVRLERAKTLMFYADYAAIYRQLHAEYPELRAVARAESEDDMQAYLEDEHCSRFLWTVPGPASPLFFGIPTPGSAGSVWVKLPLPKRFALRDWEAPYSSNSPLSC